MNEYGNFIRRADLIKNLIARQQLDEKTAKSKPNKALVDANKQRWLKYQELLRDSLTARIAAANSSGGGTSGGGGNGALTTAWIAARNITDVPTINAVNTFETNINSIVNKFHHIHFLFNGDATKNNYNFIGNSAFNLTYFGTIIHASTGIKSTSNGYFKTGYIPTTHSTLNSAHQSIYSRTSMGLAAKCVFGAYGTNNGSSIVAPFWDGSPRYAFNQNGVWTDNNQWINLPDGFTPESPLPWSDSRRFAIGSRTSSTNIEAGINNNYRAKTANMPSTLRSNSEVFGLAMNFQGTPMFYSENEISFISQGEGLTHSEILILNTAVDTLMTTLGINV